MDAASLGVGVWTFGSFQKKRGDPNTDPKYCNPVYRDPQNGTPNFRKPPFLPMRERVPIFVSVDHLRNVLPALKLQKSW